MQAKAQDNIAEVDGPLSVCANVPITYRVIFNNTCSNPNVVDIRKYNQNMGGGNLISHTFVTSGTLSDGRLYQDFNLTFNINFGSFPNGDLIGIVFQSVCNADNNTGQLKPLSISIIPPPTVEITADNNVIITRQIFAGVYSGSKTLNGYVSTATANTTYKWSVTGNSFSVSGADNLSTVSISSNTTVPTSGTVMLQAGVSGCGTLSASFSITARSGTARLSNATATSASTKLSADDPIQLVIYGNPVNDKIVAKITNIHDLMKKDVLIYDANNHLVKIYRGYTNNSTINVNISDLSNGVYFLNVVSPGTALSLTKKFVIQR
ncbi:T9SS type A sorting domain-containing protein [Chitinophaga oryziterrae]|nr:T9SS type A sorting domain-containing protein [Chitinophaga oryziterrae]